MTGGFSETPRFGTTMSNFAESAQEHKCAVPDRRVTLEKSHSNVERIPEGNV